MLMVPASEVSLLFLNRVFMRPPCQQDNNNNNHGLHIRLGHPHVPRVIIHMLASCSGSFGGGVLEFKGQFQTAAPAEADDRL